MNYTIDANVFVASARSGEPEHLTSIDFLTVLQAEGETVFCPSIVLAESSAAISRRTGDPVAAMALVSLVKNFAGLKLEAVSPQMAERAAQIAADYRLLGADSVYVAVAEQFSATLVTLDSTILQRASKLVIVTTPADWLLAQQANSNLPS